MLATSLIERDLKHLWHPCAQMKDYQSFLPIEIVGASGSYLHTASGERLIDATSSWWCKSLGHQHPRLKAALLKQINRFEHLMLAHTTNNVIVDLSEKLTRLSPKLAKVLYASDGSSAVEIAMKMSVHARKILGESQKCRFLALKDGYHGETLGALSVSDLGIYKAPYQELLIMSDFISPLPYVNSIEDPLWLDASHHFSMIEKELIKHLPHLTAIVIEPIIQAAAGMKMYSQDFLKRLRAFTKKHKVHLIADEIMTGIGRTGKMLALDHAGIDADFICLSKGLTGGWLPLSATLTTQAIFDLFYDDYAAQKSFLHSHTHSGNVLAASVAVEVLNVMEEENICAKVNELGSFMRQCLEALAIETGQLVNVRGIGAIAAADLLNPERKERLGFKFYQKAAELGALIRPIGQTIYWVPPLNTDKETILALSDITKRAILNL